MHQNYPNPFNPETVISFDLPAAAFATVSILDTAGREIAHLINGSREAGRHSVSFNAAQLSSGVYFYRLSANGISLTKRMALVK